MNPSTITGRRRDAAPITAPAIIAISSPPNSPNTSSGAVTSVRAAARCNAARLRAMPASSCPAPMPMQSLSGAGARRCASSAADAVLPIPISPIAMTSAPATIASTAMALPRASAAFASSGAIAGSRAALAVPRRIFAAMSAGCGGRSAATPASITQSVAPVAAANALALARPARNVFTIATVTADGYCETPSSVSP